MFAVELAAIPWGIDASSQALGNWLGDLVLPFEQLYFWMKVLRTLLPDVIGLLAGYMLKPFPSFIREPARWIFVIPAILFPIALGVSFFADLHTLWFSIFGERGANYDGLGVVGLFFPVCGIFLFSIGVRAGDRHSDPLAKVYEDEDLGPKELPARVRPTLDLEQAGDHGAGEPGDVS